MKTFIAILALVPTLAFANSEKLSCRNADGSVEFTREILVTKSTDRQTLVTDMESFIGDSDASSPSQGDVITFKSRYEDQPGVVLTVKKASPWKKVAGKEEACGVGFETNRFSLKAELVQGDLRSDQVFTCFHYLGYHGHGCK